MKLKQKMKMEQEYDEQEENDEFKDQDDDQQESQGSNSQNGDGNEVRRRSSKSVDQKDKGCCSCKMPKCYVKLSKNFYKYCDDQTPEGKAFEKGIIVLILLNTAFLASEHYE